MYSSHKHSYLQKRSSGVNARIINRSVDLARRQPTIDSGDFELPLNRLTSEQPCIPIENVDVIRRPLAFGRLAMPKLRRELHSKDPAVVMQAILTITELVHNPERAYEAINLKIPDRLTDLLTNENPAVRERVCILLTCLANAVDGKRAIVKNSRMLTNLCMAVDDVEGAVRIKVAKCLETLASFWLTADELVEFGFIPVLLDSVCKDDERIVAIHLETLHSLMTGCVGIDYALEAEAYPTFLSLLECRSSNLLEGGLKCLRRLLCTVTGKRMALSSSILPELNRLLHHEEPEVYGSAASIIMFATIEVGGVINATKIKNLPDRLVTICHDDHHEDAKMFALKALTNMCAHPEMKKYLTENYKKQIESITSGGNKEIQKCIDLLLNNFNWVPNLY